MAKSAKRMVRLAKTKDGQFIIVEKPPAKNMTKKENSQSDSPEIKDNSLHRRLDDDSKFDHSCGSQSFSLDNVSESNCFLWTNMHKEVVQALFDFLNTFKQEIELTNANIDVCRLMFEFILALRAANMDRLFNSQEFSIDFSDLCR